MAKLIDENHYLVPMSVKETYTDQSEYLVSLTNLEKVANQSGDIVQEKLSTLQNLYEQMNKTITNI